MLKITLDKNLAALLIALSAAFGAVLGVSLVALVWLFLSPRCH
jgi:hypothetical protein